MKKLIIAILLLCCSSAFAGGMITIGKKKSTSSCGSLTFVGTPGDTETFENSAGNFCTQSFTETDPDSIINTYSTAQYKNGTHSTYFGFTGSQTGLNRLRADIGAGDSGFTLSYWLYLTGTNSALVRLAILSTHATIPDAGSENAIMVTPQDQGGGNFRFLIYNSSGGSPGVSGNYAYNVWLRLLITFVSGGTSTVAVYNASNSLQETVNVTSTPSISPRYFYWGEIPSSPDTNMRDFYIDDVQYNSTNP